MAVILDGGNATELGREHADQLRDAGDQHVMAAYLSSSPAGPEPE